jgi:signal transduction histidine kinase
MFRLTALGVDTPQGDRTVLVAQSLDEINEGTEAAIGALAAGMPLLTLVVGAATFLFVGRSLRPVDAMLRQADTITAKSLHTRLPVPAAHDEIAALATTMNTMLDRIEAATAAQRRFVADASHELRSPLATIHAGLDLLGAGDLPPAAGAHVGRMHRESERMARLLSDLLLLARFDESGLPMRRTDVDLDDLVYTERERLADEHPSLRVTTRVTPIRVDGDPHHLQRALRNLLDNAARHARSTVVINLESRDGTAELTICDDGPGIAEADRERVFDRFVRIGDDRSRLAGGTGLGLPIARDIVTAHGGTLTAVESPTGGALLRIALPI